MTDNTTAAAKLLPFDKLTAKRTAYSSIVGSSVMLTDEKGRCVGQIMVVGLAPDLNATREQREALSNEIAARWNTRQQPAPPADEPDYDTAERIIDEWVGARLKDGFASSWHYGELLNKLGIHRFGLAARPKVEDAEVGGVLAEISRESRENHVLDHVMLRRWYDLLERLAGDKAERERLGHVVEDMADQLRSANSKLAELEAELAKADAVIDNQRGTMDEIDKYEFQKITNAAIARHAARQQQKASAEPTEREGG